MYDSLLMRAGALAAGYRACKRCAPLGEHREAATVSQLCRYLANHRDRVVTLADLAKVVHSSPFTVQRMFTRVLGVSPREYQAQLRANEVRLSLSDAGASVTDAIYQAGYSSSSRFYEQAAENLGMSPTRFRERGLNETIRFATAPCELGLLLVAATERGICSVMLGDRADTLEKLLRQQFRAARILPDTTGMAEQVKAVLAAMTDHPAAGDIPSGCARNRVPGAGMAGAAGDSPRGNAELCTTGRGYRAADRGAGGGPGLRYEPGRDRGSLPPRDRQRRFADWIPVGRGAKEEAFEHGKRWGGVCAVTCIKKSGIIFCPGYDTSEFTPLMSA